MSSIFVTLFFFLCFYSLIWLCLLPINLHRWYWSWRVRREGQELILQGKEVAEMSRGMRGIIVYRHFLSFMDYRFVTDRNPYGVVRALNRSRITYLGRLQYLSGCYRVRYLQRKGKTYLLVLEPD